MSTRFRRFEANIAHRGFATRRFRARRLAGRARRVPVARRAKRRRRNQRTAGFLGIELKFYDTSLVGAPILAPTDSAGGELDPSATIVFNTVTQGDGEQQRDGRKINMRSLGLKGIIRVAPQNDQTTVDQTTTVFLALVHDSQTNGATIASENVYTNKGASANTQTSPFRNLQFSKRFNVLKTLTIDLPQPTAIGTGLDDNIEQGGYTVSWNMFVDLKNMPVTYSSTSESIVNITDNSLHLIGFCTHVGTVPLLDYNARLRFVG